MYSSEVTYPSKRSFASLKPTDVDEDSNTSSTTAMDAAESFLDSYEEMLQHQKEEVAATLRHLEPLLELLESKSSSSSCQKVRYSQGDETLATPFEREFTYQQLRQALSEVAQDPSLRFAASDLQWNMVLEILSQTLVVDDDDDNDISAQNERISWAEIVMCYRICIIGMQTLDQTPQQNELRARVRQRSVQMIEAFRQSSTHPKSAQKHSPDRKEGKHSKDSQRGLMRWADFIFLAGALMLGIRVLLVNLGHLNMDASYGWQKTPELLSFSPAGRIEDLLIPGPIISPYAAEALKIPGPAISPFPMVSQPMVSESPFASPVEAFEYKAVPASVQALINEPSMPAKMQRTIAPSSCSEDASDNAPSRRILGTKSRMVASTVHVLRETANATAKKTGLAVVAIAGGTAAAGFLAPMATSAVASLVAGMTATTTISSLFPIGATVVLSTWLAHGIRDLFAKLLFNNKRKNSATY
jgi:hypothetical protein